MINAKTFTHDDYKAMFDHLVEVPYEVFRKTLYTGKELFDAFDPDDLTSFDRCYDTRVYNHIKESGLVPVHQREASARSIHDTCIWNAMQCFLCHYLQTRVVGVMGGHAMLRTDAAYRQTAMISKRLTEEGCLMISGGGPGAMEATHFGAWMAGRSESEVDDALQILAASPGFKDAGWLATAFQVVNRYPQSNYESLAIPTWYYGHEPPTIFATRIAKFFNNSIREDTILTEAYGGLIYMPGSAGTIQEIFQEAVQDHYESFGFASPMIFVGQKYWTEDVPVWPFIQAMIQKGRYRNLILGLYDSTDEIVDFIKCFQQKQDACTCQKLK